jgi:hypothetical protein
MYQLYMCMYQSLCFIPSGSFRKFDDFIQTHPHCMYVNPFSILSQFYKYHFFSLAQTWVHSYAITSRAKQAVYTNFQL